MHNTDTHTKNINNKNDGPFKTSIIQLQNILCLKLYGRETWPIVFNPDKIEQIRINNKSEVVQCIYNVHGSVLKKTIQELYLALKKHYLGIATSVWCQKGPQPEHLLSIDTPIIMSNGHIRIQ